MKKLLGVSLACAVTLVCGCFAVACGGDEDDNTLSDKEKAQEAISSVKTMYITASEETPGDYEVIGQTKTKSGTYDVNWSVSTEQEGVTLSDYVSVGTMDETTKLVTISVTSGPVAVTYTLTASVTVGEETESVSFTRKTVALLSVAKVYEIGNSLELGSYYTVDGEVAVVAVKGYVVDPGTYDTGYKNYNKVYIVDEYSADKTAESADALLIYRIVLDDIYLTGGDQLHKGDLITVSGVIQNYNSSSSSLVEVNYHSALGINITCIGLEKAERTDAEKVESAYNAVDLSVKDFVAVENISLPTENNEATLTWAVKTENVGDIVAIENNELKILSVPDVETPITITVTIKSGDVTQTKDFEIVVGQLTLAHAGTEADPFTVADVNKIFGTLDGDSNEYYSVDGVSQKVYVTGVITTVGTIGSFISKMYIGDSVDDENPAMIYTINYSATVPNTTPLRVGDTVTVQAYIQNYGGTYELCGGKNPDYAYIMAWEPENLLTAVLDGITLPENMTENVSIPEVPAYAEGVTLTFESSNTDAISIDEENNQLVVTRGSSDVEVTITVTASKGDDEETITIDVTVVGVNVAIYDLSFADDTLRESQDANSQVWKVGDNVTFTNNKASSGTDCSNYVGPVRLYASSTITVDCTGMTEIIFAANTAAYATVLNNSLAGVEGVTVTVDDKTVTVTFEAPTDTITFSLTAQTRLDSLQVKA